MVLSCTDILEKSILEMQNQIQTNFLKDYVLRLLKFITLVPEILSVRVYDNIGSEIIVKLIVNPAAESSPNVAGPDSHVKTIEINPLATATMIETNGGICALSLIAIIALCFSEHRMYIRCPQEVHMVFLIYFSPGHCTVFYNVFSIIQVLCERFATTTS